MKRLFFVALMLFTCARSYSQHKYLNLSREAVRQAMAEDGNKFVKDGLADSNEQYDIYTFKTDQLVDLVFYYDYKYVCRRYKVLVPRDMAPSFIERVFNKHYTRTSSVDWVSKDKIAKMRMTVTPDSEVIQFDFVEND